jgi:hypothetical protein
VHGLGAGGVIIEDGDAPSGGGVCGADAPAGAWFVPQRR